MSAAQQRRAAAPRSSAAQQRRPDIAQERAAFLAWLPSVDATKVKAVDESGVIQGMRLAYG